jgi:hypothetical protein
MEPFENGRAIVKHLALQALSAVIAQEHVRDETSGRGVLMPSAFFPVLVTWTKQRSSFIGQHQS